MAERMPDNPKGRSGKMDELLLERQRLDQVIKNCFSREITIMFSDICGFTRYTDLKGDLQSRAMLLKHNHIVIPAIEGHEGNVIEVIGDGIMAAFTDPLNAVQAAVDIQQKLQADNVDTAPDEAIHVKIGIHCGNVLLDEGADFQSLTGDVANVAARIQGHAELDEILVVSPGVVMPDHIRQSFTVAVVDHRVRGKYGGVPKPSQLPDRGKVDALPDVQRRYRHTGLTKPFEEPARRPGDDVDGDARLVHADEQFGGRAVQRLGNA